jgi:hypothetical protein
MKTYSYFVIYDEFVSVSGIGNDEDDFWRTNEVSRFETRFEAKKFYDRIINDKSNYRDIYFTRAIEKV